MQRGRVLGDVLLLSVYDCRAIQGRARRFQGAAPVGHLRAIFGPVQRLCAQLRKICFGAIIRQHVQEKFNLPGSACPEALCWPCNYAQLYRELIIRGATLDMCCSAGTRETFGYNAARILEEGIKTVFDDGYHCAQCHEGLPPNAHFCAKCGAANAAAPLSCTQCMTTMQRDAKFWPNCGLAATVGTTHDPRVHPSPL